ncbi:MAG: hypothetical protein MR793_06320 [Bacteroidales bacterium]|nr:hypothetical protein [Bacteroidales bacterium]MDY5781370.1 hypothetical protein [Candidatus Cryptobacteroides sp.]
MKRFDMYLGRIAAAAILLVTGGFLSSCEKNDDGPKLDKITVTVSEVSATATTAEFIGVVERQAKAPADAIVGFEYSNSEDFTGAAEVTGLAEQFTEKVTGLSVSTKYYYRTFVDKKGERTYGETASFTTNSASVSIVTVDASSTKAVIQCEVDPEVAGSSSLKAGIELSADVTFAAVMDITAKTISKEGAYTINIEDLALNTFYYIRPYIEDAGSRVYGTAKAFATTDVKVALDVNLNKALLRVVGSVYVDEADIDVITVGYQISTDSEFSASATTDVVIPASQYAYYDSNTMFNRRRPSTDYYYRSYVVLDGVYYYNNISRHTTDPLEVKGYNLLPATIKATSASAMPSVDAWDLTGVDEMGVAYSTDADFLTSRTGISYTAMQEDPFFGGYMLALSGLTPATGYYYTYYIKRGSEYEYGPAESVLSFATQPDASCISVNDVKPESYTPGKVIFTGSSKVSELAKTTYSIVTSLEYATDKDFSDKTVKEFTGNLSFQKNDLKPATTYYYRVALAYRDSKGDKTLYTAVKSFTTNEMVVSVGASTTNIKATSIKLGIGFDYSMWDRTGLVTGAIMTTDPACELTSEGVIMKESYDVEDMFFGTMTMLDEFTGLEPATKYYFRSFIKRGEEYKLGEIKSVTTLGPAASYVAVTDMMDGRLVLDLNVQRDDASKFTIGIEYAFDEKFTDGAKKMNIDRSKDNQSQTAAYRKQLNINMPSTDVYYRFYYAKTGTTDYVYGDTKKFRMLDLTESQIVPAASGITANSVTISGALNTGSYSVAKLSIGVLCAATANPTLETAGVVSSPMKLELDWFTFSYVLVPTTLNGLGSGTTYYYRIYYKVGENVIYLPVHTFETVSAPTTVEVTNDNLAGFSGALTGTPKTTTVGDLTLTLNGIGGGGSGSRYAKLGTSSNLAITAPKAIKAINLTVDSFTGTLSVKESPSSGTALASQYLNEGTSANFTLSSDLKTVYITSSANVKITALSVTY